MSDIEVVDQPSTTEITNREESRASVLHRHRLGDALQVTSLYLVSIAAAVGLSAALVMATGGSPGSVFDALLDGAFRQDGAWGRTLAAAAPLLIVALGVVISNKAGLVNIGQEGQLLIGAALAAYMASRLPGPGPLVLLGVLAAGIVGGAIWAGIAGVLKFSRGVPEVITTLLMVFIAAQVVNYGLTRSWLLLDNDPARVQSLNTGSLLDPGVRLPQIDLFGNRFHIGVVVALVLALVVAVALARTIWGFRLRMLGLNATTAQRAGVSASRTGGLALLVSGGFAGLAGAVMLTGGTSYRLTTGFSNNIGWEGLLVALLARDRPLVAIPTALAFAALRTGGGVLASTGVARTIVDVVQALLVLALLLPPVYLAVRDRRRALAASRARI
ncbi:MAG: ABC transporter permease [Acidimicrobiales bacterium]